MSPHPHVSVLDEAVEIIDGDREDAYGHSEPTIAALWTTWLEARKPGPLTGHDVDGMMALLKLARLAKGYQRDSAVDLAGYAGRMEAQHRVTEDIWEEAKPSLPGMVFKMSQEATDRRLFSPGAS